LAIFFNIGGLHGSVFLNSIVDSLHKAVENQ